MNRLILLCGALALPSLAIAATPIQSLGAIEQAVLSLVAAGNETDGDVEISVGRLDPRLRLPRCEVPLETRHAQAPRSSGPMSIEVRCVGARPWSLYVPVTLERYDEVVVTSRPLARGHTVSADDITLARRRVDLTRNDFLLDAGLAVGSLTTRNLAAGEVLGQRQLRRPHLVRRGDRVTLSSGNAAISVSVKGEALADAAAGERVRVRNLGSARIIEGTVTAPGTVVVANGTML